MSEPDPTGAGTYVAVVLLRVQPAWLRLDRPTRNAKADVARRVLARHPGVAVRWLDAEAFSGACTDVLLAEAPDPWAWYRAWEELRDTELFSEPYFVVEQLVLAVEEGYRRYEASVAG